MIDDCGKGSVRCRNMKRHKNDLADVVFPTLSSPAPWQAVMALLSNVVARDDGVDDADAVHHEATLLSTASLDDFEVRLLWVDDRHDRRCLTTY